MTSRIFPVTAYPYEVGKEVSWQWGHRSWNETWYRDPDSDAIKLAWTRSTEFLGRHLDEL